MFARCRELTDVICLAAKVPKTEADAFKDSDIGKATLYVASTSLNDYRAADPWKNFGNILAVSDYTPVEVKKISTPSIRYDHGQLSFSCDTEGVTFVTDITDADIKKQYNSAISLTATYHISVYATKNGYDKYYFEDSDVATAILCWIDVDPKTEGLADNVANVQAKAVLIQSNAGTLSVYGADEGSPIRVYDMSGKMVGSANAGPESTMIPTSLRPGEIGLVKIGSKTIKVVM